MSLEELFRLKLENAGVDPSFAAGDKLMRRLRFREFMRFNPARLNVYYIGAIIAGLITAGVLLFSGKDSNEEQQHVKPAIEKFNSEISINAGKVIRNDENSIQKQDLEIAEHNEPVVEAASDSNLVKRNEGIIKQAAINGSAIEKIVINVQSEGKLQAKSVLNDPLFIPSSTSGCPPLRINFIVNNASFDTYRWNFGDDGFSKERDPEWVFEREGDYNVTLAAVSDGRTYSHSVLIHVYSRPVAGFALSPEKPVLPDDEVSFINYSSNAVSYTWNFGDGNSSSQTEPRHSYKEYGNYTVSLKVHSENGCMDSAVLTNAFLQTGYFIEMPNAFIPNPYGPSGGFYSSKSDESAEIFHPMFSGVNEYHLTIYSKLGMVLFESEDINVGWDGYYKGQLSNPGVYIWKVTGRYRNGVSFSSMGDVTLLKK